MTTRNRTAMFLRFREEQKSLGRGGEQNPYTVLPMDSFLGSVEGDVQGREVTKRVATFGSTVDGFQAVHMESTQPPQWVVAYERCRKLLDEISLKMEEPARLRKGRLLVTFAAEDKNEEDSRIVELSRWIMRAIQQAE